MDKTEIRKNRRKILTQLFLAHIGIGFFHILLFNMGHPLFKVLSDKPLWLQIVCVSLVAFVVYGIVGFVMSVLKTDKQLFYYVVDRGILIFFGVLLLTYGALYLISLWRSVRNLWLVYSLVNPLFGTYMYRLADTSFFSLWWLVSTVVPPLGFYFGTLIRMKYEVR